jgi:putative endonuclease
MSDRRQAIGREAEDAAAAFLTRRGVRVVGRNVRFREGEIDLVCRERDVWVFVEVKCRRAHWDSGPGAAVSWLKQRRLVRLAQIFLKARGLAGAARCRFDVVAVTLDDGVPPRIDHIVSAFDAN